MLGSGTCVNDSDVNSYVVSVTGTNFKSMFNTMLHLVMTKRSEVVVTCFLQKILTSFANVMRNSHITNAEFTSVVSIRVPSRIA